MAREQDQNQRVSRKKHQKIVINFLSLILSEDEDGQGSIATRRRLEDRSDTSYELYHNSGEEPINEPTTITTEDTRNSLDPKSHIDVKSVLDDLQFDYAIVSRDYLDNRAPRHLDEEVLQKLNQVSVSSKFRDWLGEENTSSALLVQGHLDTAELHSPMSRFCAEILTQNSNREKVVILSHFCAMHTEKADPFSYGKGLVRSLIGQLLHLAQYTFDLSFLNEKFMDDVVRGSIAALCRLFTLLFYQLPPDFIVFCIIDSISFYETRLHSAITGKAINSLMRLVKKSRSQKNEGPIVKVLVTDTNQSSSVWRYFDENILNLRDLSA